MSSPGMLQNGAGKCNFSFDNSSAPLRNEGRLMCVLFMVRFSRYNYPQRLSS